MSVGETVSVIIAAKDAERWIVKTLESLKQQTYQNWECVISVNGSSDRTEEIARTEPDRRVRTITSSIPNKSSAVNRALNECQTRLVCILDADDLWTPEKLEKQLSSMCALNVDILGTQMLYINELGDEQGDAPALPTTHSGCISWLSQKNNPIANSSVMYRKQIHELIGYYDPEKFAVEDYDMWMRAMRAGLKMSNCSETMLMHRIHSSSNYNSTNRQQILKQLVDATNEFYKNFDRS